MARENLSDNRHSSGPNWRRLAFGLTLFLLLAIAGYFLLAEHRAHILGGRWLVPALLLVCIAMHFFMHGAHGGHSRPDDRQRSDKTDTDNE